MSIPRLVSAIFHPLFMPLLGLIIVFNSSTYLNSSVPDNLQWITIFTVFIFTCLLPLLNVLFLRRKGLVKSIYLKSRQERKLPYAITIIYYIILYLFLIDLQLPPILYRIILGSTLAAILAFTINFKWKISAHMIGVGGLVGMILGISERLTLDLNGLLIFLFLVSGSVGYARLKLKAHSPAQIYTGFLVGAGSLLLMLL